MTECSSAAAWTSRALIGAITIGMSLSEPTQRGFALAALLAGDRALAHVRPALADADAEAIASVLAARTGPRDAWVAELLAAVRPRLTALPAGLSLRMAGLLAAHLPRVLGRAALADAPPLRADFTVSHALTPCLLRIARAQAEGAPGC